MTALTPTTKAAVAALHAESGSCSLVGNSGRVVDVLAHTVAIE